MRHLSASTAVALDGARVEASAELHGASFDAHATLAGPRDALALELEAHGANRDLSALHARGALHAGALDLTSLEAHTGATRIRGAAHLDERGIDGAFDAEVAPAEAALLRIHPAAPIRLRVALHGPLRAVDVRADGRLRAARVFLSARIDLPARRGQAQVVARDLRLPDFHREAPELAFSGAFDFDGALRANAGVEGELTVSEGSLRVPGARFDRLRGAARVRLGQPGEARVGSLSGRLLGQHPRNLAVQTLVRWDRRAIRCDGFRARVDDSQATGDMVYAAQPAPHGPRVIVRAQTLSLSPSLIHEALHLHPSRTWPGRARLEWTRGHYQVAFALHTDKGPATGEARIRTDRGALELPVVVVALDGNRFRGAARVKNGESAVSIDELLIQPQLVHSLWPELTPVRPLRIKGAAAGPLHAVELRLVATAGPSEAIVRGRVDMPARSFRLSAALDAVRPIDVEQTKTSARVTLELTLDGKLVEGGVAGTLTVRHALGMLEGTQLYRGRLDAHLDGPRFELTQLLLDLPGVTLEAKGGGTWRDFHIGYGVVITDALELKQMPTSLRVMVGLTQVVPGRTVVGTIKREHGGKIETTHKTIPPGFRWLSLVYDLLRGRVPKLTVQ